MFLIKISVSNSNLDFLTLIFFKNLSSLDLSSSYSEWFPTIFSSILNRQQILSTVSRGLKSVNTKRLPWNNFLPYITKKIPIGRIKGNFTPGQKTSTSRGLPSTLHLAPGPEPGSSLNHIASLPVLKVRASSVLSYLIRSELGWDGMLHVCQLVLNYENILMRTVFFILTF